VVRSATSGSGSSVCGVAPGSYGSKELHYVLRTLSSAACHNHLVFTEVAKNILRINLVTLPKRGKYYFVKNFMCPLLLISIHVHLQMEELSFYVDLMQWYVFC